QKVTGNHGNYHREKYFIEVKDQVLKQFTLKNPLSQTAQDVLKNIDTNSVSIHIRRGDYVNNNHHGSCDLGYYYKALHHIKSKISSPHFFIFSDDIQWAKDNMQIGEATFVSNGDIPEVEELILMSMCSHNIIANSTFSWWAAYLNQNLHKIVIAPKQWTRKETSDTLEILPKTWIQL
ncbi:alpha-1,2-fucosyltransferase, partial [Candidatus Parcubacteria bacterium]|nr:alpha-1,2-fucosyltransferase [Candidatus Parcubacteria bacterium]